MTFRIALAASLVASACAAAVAQEPDLPRPGAVRPHGASREPIAVHVPVDTREPSALSRFAAKTKSFFAGPQSNAKRRVAAPPQQGAVEGAYFNEPTTDGPGVNEPANSQASFNEPVTPPNPRAKRAMPKAGKSTAVRPPQRPQRPSFWKSLFSRPTQNQPSRSVSEYTSQERP